ncbi:MAG TPA: hypothetical protein VIK97_00550 [Casimicrobiaceae bacterium]
MKTSAVGPAEFAVSYGRKVIVYIKAENYLTPAHIGRMVDAGIIAAIKCAVVRDDPVAEALRAAYLRLEDLRDTCSPVRMLHDAVTLSSLADMGPMLPQLSNIDAVHHAAIRAAAQALLAHDRGLS